MYTPEAITEAFEKAPQSVRRALDASHYGEALQKIATELHVPLDVLASVESQILLTAVGLAKAENFSAEVGASTGMSGEMLSSIVARVDAEVFVPLRELIKKYSVLDEEPDADEEGETDTEEDDAWKDALLDAADTPETTALEMMPLEIAGNVSVMKSMSTPDLSQFAQKLSTSVSSGKSVTDQSMKTAPAPVPVKGFDPYREAL